MKKKKNFLITLIPLKSVNLHSSKVLAVLFSPVMTIYYGLFQKTVRQNPGYHGQSPSDSPSYPRKIPDKEWRMGGGRGSCFGAKNTVNSLFIFILDKF
jgi:hypothetical protein